MLPQSAEQRVSAVTNGAINFLVSAHYGHSESRNLYWSFYERVTVNTTAAGVAQPVSLTNLRAGQLRFQKDGQDVQHRLGKWDMFTKFRSVDGKSGLNDPWRLRGENNGNGSQRNAVKGGLDSFGAGRQPVARPCSYHYEASGQRTR